eukprot:COSAG02_NODE_498_length_21087_cov_33.272394_18_plen_156_part_00
MPQALELKCEDIAMMDIFKGNGTIRLVQRSTDEMAVAIPMPALDLSFTADCESMIDGSSVPRSELPISKHDCPLSRAIELLLRRDLTQTYHAISWMDSRIEKDFIDDGMLSWHKYADDDPRIGRLTGPGRGKASKAAKQWFGKHKAPRESTVGGT